MGNLQILRHVKEVDLKELKRDKENRLQTHEAKANVTQVSTSKF